MLHLMHIVLIMDNFMKSKVDFLKNNIHYFVTVSNVKSKLYNTVSMIANILIVNIKN